MTTRDAARNQKIQSRIRPITKISISEEIAQQIMNLISSGVLKAGQRLPSERELCRNFGCGRSSLREALRCLSIVGILNARVGDGTSVALNGGKFLGTIVEWRMITEQHDIENLLEVRIALEGVSAAKAASLRSEAELAHLEELLQKMEAAIGEPKRFAALDLDLHIALARAASNALLFDLISMIRGQLALGLSTVLTLPRAIALSHQEHAAVVAAVRHQDGEGAREAMRAHLEAALRRYHGSLEKPLAARKKPKRVAAGKP